MMWRDVADLLTVTTATDAEGISTETYTTRTIFVNKKDVRQSEFYQAAAQGLKPSLMLEILVSEYSDEARLSFEGSVYKIIRTYSKNGERMELVCEREAAIDG
jgi:SPP1 family predicted phage head-tail adaptor